MAAARRDASAQWLAELASLILRLEPPKTVTSIRPARRSGWPPDNGPSLPNDPVMIMSCATS
jgi:hypothetical protein